MTKITAQPKLASQTEYLEAFARQTLKKKDGPWIMHDPNNFNRPSNVSRGLVMFYSGDVPSSDDMIWAWGGTDKSCIAAYYPLEVRSDEDDTKNPFLYWDGRYTMPPKVGVDDLVEVIFRDGDRRTDDATDFCWAHGDDLEVEDYDIVAYRVIPDSPLMTGVWHDFSGNKTGRLPKGIQPHTMVSLRLRGGVATSYAPAISCLRDGIETSYAPAISWDWSVDREKPDHCDIVAFKIKD